MSNTNNNNVIKTESNVQQKGTTSSEAVNTNVAPAQPPPPPPPQPQPQPVPVLQLVEEPVKWNWITVDGSPVMLDIHIPCIIRRDGRRYLSVRMVESAVLIKFENNLSDEARNYGVLESFVCTRQEIDLLNEINNTHTDNVYGRHPFDINDKLVLLDRFLGFFDILKRTCGLKSNVARLPVPTQAEPTPRNVLIQSQPHNVPSRPQSTPYNVQAPHQPTQYNLSNYQPVVVHHVNNQNNHHHRQPAPQITNVLSQSAMVNHNYQQVLAPTHQMNRQTPCYLHNPLQMMQNMSQHHLENTSPAYRYQTANYTAQPAPCSLGHQMATNCPTPVIVNHATNQPPPNDTNRQSYPYQQMPYVVTQQPNLPNHSTYVTNTSQNIYPNNNQTTHAPAIRPMVQPPKVATPPVSAQRVASPFNVVRPPMAQTNTEAPLTAIYLQTPLQTQLLVRPTSGNNPTPPLTPASLPDELMRRIGRSRSNSHNSTNGLVEPGSNNVEPSSAPVPVPVPVVVSVPAPVVPSTPQPVITVLLKKPETTPQPNLQKSTVSKTTTTTTNNSIEPVAPLAEMSADDVIIILEQPSKQSSSSKSKNEPASQLKKPTTSDSVGNCYVRINEFILPVLKLYDQKFKISRVYPACISYLSVEHLSLCNLIPTDLLDDRQRLAETFRKYFRGELQHAKSLNALVRELPPERRASLNELNENEPNSKVDLINLIELILTYYRSAVYVKEIDPAFVERELSLKVDYRRILQQRGGIVQLVKSASDAEIMIVPFVHHNDMILVDVKQRKTLNEMTLANPGTLNIDVNANIVRFNDAIQLKMYSEFMQLLLTYCSIGSRNRVVISDGQFINIRHWIELYPRNFVVVCRFTNNFPVDWMQDLERYVNNEPNPIVFEQKITIPAPVPVQVQPENTQTQPPATSTAASTKDNLTTIALPGTSMESSVSMSPTSIDSSTSGSPIQTSKVTASNEPPLAASDKQQVEKPSGDVVLSTQCLNGVRNNVISISKLNSKNRPDAVQQADASTAVAVTPSKSSVSCSNLNQIQFTDDELIVRPKPRMCKSPALGRYYLRRHLAERREASKAKNIHFEARRVVLKARAKSEPTFTNKIHKRYSLSMRPKPVKNTTAEAETKAQQAAVDLDKTLVAEPTPTDVESNPRPLNRTDQMEMTHFEDTTVCDAAKDVQPSTSKSLDNNPDYLRQSVDSSEKGSSVTASTTLSTTETTSSSESAIRPTKSARAAQKRKQTSGKSGRKTQQRRRRRRRRTNTLNRSNTKRSKQFFSDESSSPDDDDDDLDEFIEQDEDELSSDDYVAELVNVNEVNAMLDKRQLRRNRREQIPSPKNVAVIKSTVAPDLYTTESFDPDLYIKKFNITKSVEVKLLKLTMADILTFEKPTPPASKPPPTKRKPVARKKLTSKKSARSSSNKPSVTVKSECLQNLDPVPVPVPVNVEPTLNTQRSKPKKVNPPVRLAPTTPKQPTPGPKATTPSQSKPIASKESLKFSLEVVNNNTKMTSSTNSLITDDESSDELPPLDMKI